jgi:hypothetical protein
VSVNDSCCKLAVWLGPLKLSGCEKNGEREKAVGFAPTEKLAGRKFGMANPPSEDM